MNSFFVTGTDTGVGKTVVAAAIVSALRSQGADAVPMKPVQTGCDMSKDGLIAPDLEFCLQINGLQPSPEEKEMMAPCRFRPACSPHLAASLDSATISIDVILACFAQLREKYDVVVVEGAGGILVPIDAERTMLDIMVALALPVVLVSRPSLGTINHTLLSIKELRRAGPTIAGVVFCEAIPPDPRPSTLAIVQDNRAVIQRMGNAPILGRLPYLESLADGKCAPDAFGEWSRANLELGKF